MNLESHPDGHVKLLGTDPSPQRGAIYIQNAINAARPPGSKKIDTKNGLGSQTYESLNKIAQDGTRHRIFLDQLAKQRNKYSGNAVGDVSRYDYYRFHGKK